VTLFETEYEGRQAFLIVTEKECVQPVIQPQEIAAKYDYEKRIIELEKRIGLIDGRGSMIYPALSSERAVFPPPCKSDVIPLDHESDNLPMSNCKLL